MMILPNVIIGGAPRCGTSSLFTWLTDHPEVCGSRIKEPFYFMDKGHPQFRVHANYHDHGLEGYKQYFAHSSHKKNPQIFLEATSQYLYQETALDVLAAFDPLPHVVFILRKPSERTYSAYRYARNNLSTIPASLSFAQFVRIANGLPVVGPVDAALSGIVDVIRKEIVYSRYAEYVSKWIERLGRDRVSVLIFERLREEPLPILRNLSEMIGIDPSFYETYNFERRNESTGIRSVPVHRMVKRVSGFFPEGKLRHMGKRFYLKIMSTRSALQKDEREREILAELDDEFQPFNQRLAEILGVDLAAWN
ncbi:MAG: sulfotransferase domain-containing protein [Deltaproteobacteria bacterium]|nr:sulfotransferase domain-containing protein [Deltaproteobacteria bacterium]